MTTPRDLERELRQNLADIEQLVERASTALRLRPDGTGADEDVVGDLGDLTALEELNANLEEVASLVMAWRGHAAWEAEVGDGSAARRHAALRACLEQGEDKGTFEWLRAWSHSLAAGAWDDARRLVDPSWNLAPWAAWWTDRLAVVVEAFQQAPYDPRRAAARLAGVRALLESRTDPAREIPGSSGGPPEEPSPTAALDAVSLEDRVGLVLLVLRASVLAGDADVGKLGNAARFLADHVGWQRRIAVNHAYLAAQSFAARHQMDETDEAAGRADARGWVAQLHAPAAADLACAVELYRWTRVEQPAGAVSDMPAIDLARQLVATLPDVAGAVDRVSALLEPIPVEIAIELAGRLAAEGQRDRATECLERYASTWGSDPMLPYRASQVRLAVTRSAEPDAEALGAALADSAREAFWAGAYQDAVDLYEESLTVRPDEPQAMRALADALVVLSWSAPRERTEKALERAVDLCRRADGIEPVNTSTSWALFVEQHAHALLAQLERPGRSAHMWEAVRAAAGAAALGPDFPERWLWLALRLIDGGCLRAARLMADHAEELHPGQEEVAALRALLVSVAGESEDALAILAACQPAEPSAILVGARGYVHRHRGTYESAERELGDAVRADTGFSLYKYWLAEVLTLSGNRARLEPAWRAVWRDADLGELDGLSQAAWAALNLGLRISAPQLAERLITPERVGPGVQEGLAVRGLSAALAGDDRGFEDVGQSLDSITLAPLVREEGRYLAAVVEHTLLDVDPDLRRRVAARLSELVDARASQLADWPDRPEPDAVERELDWVCARAEGSSVETVVRQAVDAVRDSLAVLAAPTLPAETSPESPAGVPDTQQVTLGLPPSWFAGFEGREDQHPVLLTALPDARHFMLRRGYAVDSLTVSVHVDDRLGPDEIEVALEDGATRVLEVPPDSWYRPREWSRRETPGEGPRWLQELVAHRVSAPPGPLERLASWDAVELAAHATFWVALSPAGR